MTQLLMRFCTQKSAVISEDGVYRYALTRTWFADAPAVNWVMLNPSTADASRDDLTIKRCEAFSTSWGYGGMSVTNLFAYRSTDPRRLLDVADPSGPENDHHIRTCAGGARLIVVAWGATPSRLRYRVIEVTTMLREIGQLHYVALTLHGQPRHPSRLPGDLRPKQW